MYGWTTDDDIDAPKTTRIFQHRAAVAFDGIDSESERSEEDESVKESLSCLLTCYQSVVSLSNVAVHRKREGSSGRTGNGGRKEKKRQEKETNAGSRVVRCLWVPACYLYEPIAGVRSWRLLLDAAHGFNNYKHRCLDAAGGFNN